MNYSETIKQMVKMSAETAKRENNAQIASIHYIEPYLESVIVEPSGKTYVRRECLKNIML